MKTLLKLALKPFKPLILFCIENICRISRSINYIFHKILFHSTWGIPPSPDSFDHFIDIYYLWMKTANPMFFERGIIGRLAIKDNADILELCSGDGFCTKYFYSQKAKNITAVDYDKKMIEKAIKLNNAPNIRYLCMDLRYELPDGCYDNIIWDIVSPFSKYFTEEELHAIFSRLKRKLNSDGIISGYTSLDNNKSSKPFILKSKKQLYEILQKHFKYVSIIETNYPERTNLYFLASDTKIF